MADSLGSDIIIEDEDVRLLREWKKEFQADWEYWSDWRKDKREWERFYDGDQLSQEEKKALRERKQPEVVVNLIKPRIDTVTGLYLGQRVMQKAFDRGSRDFEAAKFITEALRHVEYITRFDEQEAEAAKEVCIGGLSWYKVRLDFDGEDPDILVETVDNDDIFSDRFAKKRNLSDAKRIWETVWVDQDDLIEMFPEHEQKIREAVADKDTFEKRLASVDPHITKIGDQYQGIQQSKVDNTLFSDKKMKRLRLTTVWYRKPVITEFAVHPDFETSAEDVTDLTQDEIAQIQKNFKGVIFFKKIRHKLNTALFISNQILEKKEDIRPHDKDGKFPLVRIVGGLTHGTKKMPFGLVKQYKSPQEEYNKRRSKLLHLINTNQIIMEEGAVDDVEKTRYEAAKPDGVLIVRPDSLFQLNKNIDVAQTQFQLLQQSQREIQDAGVANELVGQESNAESGVAIQLRQNQATLLLRELFANLRRARRQVFKLVLEEMQQYWTSEKLIRITDDPEAGEIILNQRVTDPNTGEPVVINNLGLGKYDLIIEESEDTLNLRSEQFNELVRLMEPLAKHGFPVPVDEILQASSLPNKERLVQRFREAQQAMIQAQAAQLASQAGGAAQPGAVA